MVPSAKEANKAMGVKEMRSWIKRKDCVVGGEVSNCPTASCRDSRHVEGGSYS